MTHYDVSEIKQAAIGYWPSILNQVAGIDDDYLSGSHGPCPKCGGTDRWRFTNLNDQGGAICNQCGQGQRGKGMADGLQVIGWMLNIPFPQVLQKTGEFLGVQPTRKSKTRHTKNKRDPLEDIEFTETQQTVLAWFCKSKGITPKAVNALGGRQARYRKRHTVFVFPVNGNDPNNPSGYTIYEAYGEKLPMWNSKTKETTWLKVKTVKR